MLGSLLKLFVSQLRHPLDGDQAGTHRAGLLKGLSEAVHIEQRAWRAAVQFSSQQAVLLGGLHEIVSVRRRA